ncbi:UDP-glucose dehydrogenase family protein [Lacimicrobium alkaliphilum]|uniref:UDP-glucose 6-dehydrogenase n=1 Tax=Lacimicrobium alkaliphilum TaxID=1526571 RepID=A0ABQ1RMT2_9ALTE|nr:UDP-glucose/GDP-mannose dehydrogenase family protein [Lacimicrobium alkaliphilum]GGD75174.1 UDP-glucose 6-dehydrogenase [Lacimicrobium alkaliphilum]
MKVTVFGVGYVGLVQGAVLAEVGHKVVCVDVDQHKIDFLNGGGVPIYEPGLEPLVKTNLGAGRLKFTSDAKAGIEHGDVIFIAVGTPPDEDGSADLKYVLEVAGSVAEHAQSHKIVINKSTVPVGTADKVREKLIKVQASQKASFDVVSNPEFLKEGAAVSDCMRPDRIILGTDSEVAEKTLRELYAPFNRNHDKIIVMDIRSAELTKYAANCMLATKISFMNEMSNLAERFGADIENVRRGIGSDARIGYQFIYAGCGYGGSCFPKDVQALVRSANSAGYQARILQAVEAVNYAQKEKLFEYLNLHFNGELSGKIIALWGLSFKPNTDDMREASSRVLMEKLWQAGAKVQAFDPKAMDETQRIYGHRDDLQLLGTKESALTGADALVVCTEWQMFKAPDFELIKDRLTSPVIFDGRNLFEPDQLAAMGIAYYGIGRGKSLEGKVL